MISVSRLQNFYKYFASISFEYSLHIMFALKHVKYSIYSSIFVFIFKRNIVFLSRPCAHTCTVPVEFNTCILESMRATERKKTRIIIQSSEPNNCEFENVIVTWP